jgi:hypothetical protein
LKIYTAAVKIMNPALQLTIDKAVQNTAEHFGLRFSLLRAKLCKFLLHELDSCLNKYHNTEKADDMYATVLNILFSSEYERNV